MRDPELVMRAQRAAMELERAWDRWRAIHRLGTEPLPPVSSYLGYSMEEPWGEPRVVFGIDAREAEQLAALLDHHDCEGPVYASMTANPGTWGEQDAEGRAADPGWGRVRVPSQGPPPAGRRDGGPGPSPADELPGPRARRDPAEPGPLPDTGPQDVVDGPEPQAPGEGQASAAPGLPAFRPQHEPGPYPDDDAEPAPVPEEPGEPAAAGPASGGWARRLPGGHALPRQKRAGGAAKAAGGRPEGKDRAGLADLAADLAGWAAGELPGEASHRRVSRPDRPTLG
jgi:hypothetical protein